MTSVALCVAVLVGTFAAARRSLAAGFGVLLTVGYLYGIIRANRLDGYSHLLFDASLLGLYAAHLFRPLPADEHVRLQELRTWVIVLVGWPMILFLVPTQDILVELVGLRGNVLMLPCLLLGAQLSRADMYRLALWIAVLNLVAGGVAAAQFVIGLEPFFPRNPVTDIIYRSGDVAGFTAYRIPSSFTSAHSYAGTMVTTLPLLLGGWMDRSGSRPAAILFATAIIASALGVFAAAARLPAVLLLILAVATLFSGHVRIGHKLRWVFVAAIVAWTVGGQERLQRFTTLEDTDFVSGRIAGSVNMGFFDLAQAYPLGNGLGGGGTSIPYFLQSRIRNSVTMENEYARILLEQGVPGVLLWILFLGWLFTRNPPSDPSWRFPRQMIRVSAAASFASGLLGVGLITAIPGTAVLLLSAGWLATPEKAVDRPPLNAEPVPREVAAPAFSSNGR
jgi:hypothetical protein